MIRKSLGLLAGMLVSVAVCAAGAQLSASHPDSYVVKRGDTLWGISAKFLVKPWLWPEIWQANPQVRNPHLIYPGDVLNLSFIGGVPTIKLEPSVHREAAAIPAIPLAQLQMFLKDTRVLDPDRVKSLPYVVAFEENQLRGTSGQNVYVRGLNAVPGQRWAIVRPSHMFRDYAGDGSRGPNGDMAAHPLDNNAGMVTSPWREDSRFDGHRGEGRALGLEVAVIGEAEVLRGGDPSTLLLLNTTQEIRAGDRLLPVDEHPYDAYYFPHAPTSVPAGAHVLSLADALAAAGPRQVVALSVGAAEGVNDGTTYAVFQPGQNIHDDVASDSWRRDVGKRVTLPEEYVGHVMVFRTFDHVSYGLIMDGIKPVKIGDRLRAPE